MDDRRKSQQTLGQSLLEANNGQQQDGRVHAVHPHPARLADNTHQHTLTHRRVGQCWPSSNGMKDRTTSVSTILHRMATGDPISAGGEQWKLTRAVVHLDDSWKGRVNPCPALDNERVLGLVKLRWRLRQLDFLLVHLLMALSLVETPSWCLKNRECFWTCYPDFSRNWHMDPESASITECCMLGILIVIALIDMHILGRDYWTPNATIRGVRCVPSLMRFKHITIALYSTIVFLSGMINTSFHLMAGYCRVLLYLSVHRKTMIVVSQLRHILVAVFEIWILIFINVWLFAWMGVIVFAGTEEGDLGFPNIFEGSWRLFVLFTTTNFPEIMMSALDQVRASIIYFAAFVILNVFFLAPLSLAFIFNVFRGGQKGIPRLEEDIRVRSTTAAFELLTGQGNCYVEISTLGAFLLEVYHLRGVACRELARVQDLVKEVMVRRPEHPYLDLTDFKDAVRIIDRTLDHAEWITEIQWYLPKLYNSLIFRNLTRAVKRTRVILWPGFAGTARVSMLLLDFVEAIMLVSSFITLFVSTSESPLAQMRLDWVQISVVGGFCITTVINIAVRGWHNCIRHPTFVFNLSVTTASAIIITLTFTGIGKDWGWRVMRAFRVLHLSLFVVFAPRLAFLVRTLTIMTRRAATPASVLLAWAFFMAVLGVQLFGGLICLPELATGGTTCEGRAYVDNTYTKTGLSLLNFNDVPTAFVTLFVLFVVNDWYVIVDEFVDVTGTGWARTFFIVNYIIGVAVILNLVVTVVISAFWDEYKTTVKKSLFLQNIHDEAAASANPQPISYTPLISSMGESNDSGTTGVEPSRIDVLQNVPQRIDSLPSVESPISGGHSTVEAFSDSVWGWGRLLVSDEAFGEGVGSGARVTEDTDAGVASPEAQTSRAAVGTRGPDLTNGDQEGMDVERIMTSRASSRRLAISGIT